MRMRFWRALVLLARQARNHLWMVTTLSLQRLQKVMLRCSFMLLYFRRPLSSTSCRAAVMKLPYFPLAPPLIANVYNLNRSSQSLEIEGGRGRRVFIGVTDGEGEVGAVDGSFPGHCPHAAHQSHRLLDASDAVVDLDVESQAIQLHLLHWALQAEEVDQPSAVLGGGSRTHPSPLGVHDLVPEVKVYVLLVGVDELVNDASHLSHVVLQVSVYVVLPQMFQLELETLPVFQGACKVDVLDAAEGDHPAVAEVLLVGVHDGGDGEEFLHPARGGEAALQLLSHSLRGVLPDGCDHEGEELIPLRLQQLVGGHHDQLLLARVAHEGVAQLLGVVVHVFGEVQHDHDPHVVRRDLDVGVVVVGLEEGREEAVLEGSAVSGLAGLLVSEEWLSSPLRPHTLASKLLPVVVVLGLSVFQSLNVHLLVCVSLHF